MASKTITFEDGKTVTLMDDVFSFAYRARLYSAIRFSRFQIGWEDTVEIENQHLKYLHSRWNDADLQNTGLLENINKSEQLQDFIKNKKLLKTVVNLSYPNNVYYPHTHTNEKVLVYYANLQWKNEWAGETLFFDDTCKEIIYASMFTPGRMIIFDGEIPHALRAQSSAAPHFRFTLSMFWAENE